MFEKTFGAKVKKYNDFKEAFKGVHIATMANSLGINLSTLDIGSDKDSVYRLAMRIVGSKIKGNVTPEVFCAAVSAICEAKGVPYKKYCGFALPKDASEYSKNEEQFNKMKQKGIEHPIFANHIYIEVGDTCYDLFKNVLNDDVNHFDCLEF